MALVWRGLPPRALLCPVLRDAGTVGAFAPLRSAGATGQALKSPVCSSERHDSDGRRDLFVRAKRTVISVGLGKTESAREASDEVVGWRACPETGCGERRGPANP